MDSTPNLFHRLLPWLIPALVAFFAGGLVYWWQQTGRQEVTADYEHKLTQLQQELSNLKMMQTQLEGEKLKLEQQLCKGKWEDGRCSGPMVRLISPNGGERLCLGQKFTIRWEHMRAKTVYIAFGQPGASLYYLPLLPADNNERGEKGVGEYRWTVGQAGGGFLPEGSEYFAEIRGNVIGEDNVTYKDTSDDTFSVVRCEG